MLTTHAGSNRPIEAAVTVSNDLVSALCAPAAERGLDAASCRLLLQLDDSAGLSPADLAVRVGAQPMEAEGWLDVLERADLVRRARLGFRLTTQGREVAAQLRASACPERFASLQAEIASLRDLLCETLLAFEQQVPRVA